MTAQAQANALVRALPAFTHQLTGRERNMPVPQVFGVDVGRRELAVARHDPPCRPSITNNEVAISRWLRGLQEPAMIGMESTGAYHQRFATLALAAGHRVYVLDPRRLKAYRNALGVRAKTDR